MNETTDYVLNLLTLILTAEQWQQLSEGRVEFAKQLEELAAYAALRCDPDETIARVSEFKTLAELWELAGIDVTTDRPAGA